MATTPVAVVRKSFDSRAEFFAQLRTLVSPKDIRAFHAVPGGIEITFFQIEGLASFVTRAPRDWGVTSEIEVEREVTISPALGTGHVLVPDAVIWATMERFGEVVSGCRPTHKDIGYFKVVSGLRVFRLKPREGANIPSSLTYGRAAFTVSFKGMKPKCYRCQGPHSVHACKEKICFKCRGKGHFVKDCKDGVRCTVCWRTGHSYEMCPESKNIRVELGNEWTERDPPVPRYEPQLQAGAEAGQNNSGLVNGKGVTPPGMDGSKVEKLDEVGEKESTRNGEGGEASGMNGVTSGGFFSEDQPGEETVITQNLFTPIAQQKRLSNMNAVKVSDESESDSDLSLEEIRDRGFKATPAVCVTELESASQIIVGSQDKLDISEFPPPPFRTDPVKRAASPPAHLQMWSEKVKNGN